MSIVNVIKWDANTTELAYKYPINDINVGSQLIVYPAQTAFFLKGGRIFDEFTSGTYTIKSENLPLLNRIFNLPFGGDSPFQAEVWFINQISIPDCKWGTVSPIQIEDPKYGVIIPIRSYGQYGFSVSNPRIFLEKLIGNMTNFSTEKIIQYFRGVLLSKLTSIISQKLYADNLSVININSYVEDISAYAKEKLRDFFNNYGVCLEYFSAIAINVDENDVSFQKLKATKDSLARIQILGKENYRMERSFNVLASAAENEGSGLVGTAVGVGAGVGVGTQIAGMFNEHVNTAQQSSPPSLPVVDYYIGVNGQQYGPYDSDKIKTLLTSHKITENTLIWTKGMENWQPIKEIAGFCEMLTNYPPPLPEL